MLSSRMLAQRAVLSVRAASGSNRAWQVDDWGGDLRLNLNAPAPIKTDARQVVVRVKAASVNPIDTLQVGGYGREILSKLKMAMDRSFQSGSRLPFTPGKDCAGVIESVGPAVTRFKVGDKVMGVTQPQQSRGTHSDLVTLNESATVGMPANASFQEAASLPYVACTVWNALCVARLRKENAKTNRVLIHGGSGGVGTLAVQLLRAWGTPKVVVTCSIENASLVSRLGAIPIDYRSPTATDDIIREGPYEVVLSFVDSPLSQWSDKIMGTWRNCVHVSIVSPLMKDTDRYGLPLGLASTAAKYFARSFESATQGKWFSYAYFLPNKDCLQQVARLVEEGKIKPVVERVLPFEDLPKAFELVSKRHGKGKTVLSFDKV